MSEQQKQQAEKISEEVKKLPPEMQEGALMYLQGMTAAVKMCGVTAKQEA